MAARIRAKHQDEIREKIRASQIINRLQDHVDGTVELSSTQVRSAEILLKKSVPDISTVAVDVDGELNITHSLAEVLSAIE